MPVTNAPYIFINQQWNADKLLPNPQQSQVLSLVTGKCVTMQCSGSATAECHSNYESCRSKSDFNIKRCSCQVALPRKQKCHYCVAMTALRVISYHLFPHLSLNTVGLSSCTKAAGFMGSTSFDVFINLCLIFSPTSHALILVTR